VPSQKYFPLRLWAVLRSKPDTLLHLVDHTGQPVEPPVRAAVEAAFRRIVRQFPRIDEAILADIAESVAVAISKKRSDIRAVKQYAFVAMQGRVKEWFRRHPGVEISVPEATSLEDLAGGVEDISFLDADMRRLLDQMKAQLSERERTILVLIEQGCGDPGRVAAALGLTYTGAAKAIQRAREHVKEILSDKAVRFRQLRGGR